MQLTVFAFLWASAAIFHQARWDDWAKSPSHVAVSFAAWWLLLRPRSLPAFVTLAAVQLWNTWDRLPHVSNHWLLAAGVNLTILLSFALRSTRFSDVAPALRAQFLILYFWTFFHKLNADWFHPELSCGASLYRKLAEKLVLLPTADWALDAAVYGTLIVEVALPFLLVARRTRLIGILVAAAFHLLIGVAGIYNFSATLFAGLFLFLPPEFSTRLELPAWGAVYRWATRAFLAAAALVLLSQASWSYRGPAALGVRTLADSLTGRRSLISLAFEVLWWVWALGLIAILLIVVRSAKLEWPSAKDLLTLAHPVQAVVLVIVFFNGLCPYLGLKTETVFSMYSNLRTEGSASNHRIMPDALQIADYQRDLVTIVRSSDRDLQALADRGYRVTFFELRRHLGRVGEIDVVYRRGGVESTQVHVRPPPLILQKLLYFRSVPPPDERACSH